MNAINNFFYQNDRKIFFYTVFLSLISSVVVLLNYYKGGGISSANLYNCLNFILHFYLPFMAIIIGFIMAGNKLNKSSKNENSFSIERFFFFISAGLFLGNFAWIFFL